jgi:hypothetical protein
VPETFGDILRYEDNMPVDGSVKRRSPMEELGSTGLKRAAGIIDEEFLPALRGRKAVKVFREMSQNDPIVGAMLFAIDKLIRQVDWRVEGSDNTPESTEAADFVEQCMEDMSHTWADMVSEILSMLIYGWSWHEIVYKKRIGPWESNPKTKSKYTDGRIGWRKIPIRSQETLLRWVFDETGGVQAMVQIAPPYYQTKVLPIKDSLLFRTGIHKGNPEGYSVLRNAYRPWFFKKRLEEFEAIGVERDLAGMPVAKVPSSYMQAKEGSREERVYKAYKKMVQNVRRDEHEGLVLPLEYDPETKQPLFEFELLSAGGSRQLDTAAIIQRYEQRILMSVLADFILVGHESVGSYALHVDKTGIFRAALNVFADAIADVFNRHAIPRLFELNAWKLDELPKIVPNNVDPPDLSQLSQFMTAMGGMGMQWFPDPDLEKFLRETAHLPELPDEVLEMRRQQAMMSHAMEFAQGQQQMDMVQQGYSPQQAQMMQETPPPEVQAAQQGPDPVKQADGQAKVAVGQKKAEADIALRQKKGEAQVDESRAKGDHSRAVMLERLKAQNAKQANARQAKKAAAPTKKPFPRKK